MIRKPSTMGSNNCLRGIVSVLLLLLLPWRGPGGVLYTSIDTMKESRDHEANNLLSTNEINQIVALCAAQNVTHITIDSHWEYTNVIRQWVVAIRSQGKKIYWRGRPNQWEDNNGATGIMTPASYNGAMAAFITNNPGFFAGGDIFDPCSEPETGHYWTNQYGSPVNWNSNPTATSDYNSFLLNSTTAADAALGAVGVSGVDTTVHSINGWMAQNVLSSSTLAALGNRVCIDTYPEGTNTDPTVCANLRLSDLQGVTNVWPTATVLIGESGYANNTNVNDTIQSNVLSAELNMYQAQSYLGGFNYWVGPGSSTAGGYTYVMDKAGGTWVPRPACLALSNYFGNVLVPGPPQSVSATLVDPNQVNLTWAVNTEPNLAGYNVYRSTTNGFAPGAGSLVMSNLTSNACTNTGLSAGTVYYYKVTAVSRAGLESAPSSQVSGGYVVLNIQSTGANLVLTWSQGALLEASNVNGPWATNFAALSPWTVSPTNAQKFYRVQPNMTPGPPPNPISVNFSGSGGIGTNMSSSEIAGVLAVSNWNNAAGLSGTNQALVDSTGISSGAVLTWSDPKSYVNNGSVPNIPGSYRMMKFYLDSSTNTVTTVIVTNLPNDPNGFQVYVYCDGSNSETREGAYTLSGTGITARTFTAFDNANVNFSGTFAQANNSAGNYVGFIIGNVSGFTLTVTAVNNGAQFPRGPLNGFQIVPQ
jgi:hypothetical protein